MRKQGCCDKKTREKYKVVFSNLQLNAYAVKAAF